MESIRTAIQRYRESTREIDSGTPQGARQMDEAYKRSGLAEAEARYREALEGEDRASELFHQANVRNPMSETNESYKWTEEETRTGSEWLRNLQQVNNRGEELRAAGGDIEPVYREFMKGKCESAYRDAYERMEKAEKDYSFWISNDPRDPELQDVHARAVAGAKQVYTDAVKLHGERQDQLIEFGGNPGEVRERLFREHEISRTRDQTVPRDHGFDR